MNSNWPLKVVATVLAVCCLAVCIAFLLFPSEPAFTPDRAFEHVFGQPTPDRLKSLQAFHHDELGYRSTYLTFEIPPELLPSLIDTQAAKPIYNDLTKEWKPGFNREQFQRGRFHRMFENLNSDVKSFQVVQSTVINGMRQTWFHPETGEVACWHLSEQE